MQMKNKTVMTLVAGALFSTSSCATSRRVEGNDRQVITTVIQKMCDKKDHGYVVLSSNTGAVNRNFVLDGLDATARESLIDRNQKPTNLPMLEACSGFKFVDGKVVDSYLESPEKGGMPERWMAFYAQFPDAEGVMYLSLPGYSKHGDVAIVQVASACGWLCGSGFFWILRKESDRWQVEKTIQAWQS
jgi:hypothetical protein